MLLSYENPCEYLPGLLEVGGPGVCLSSQIYWSCQMIGQPQGLKGRLGLGVVGVVSVVLGGEEGGEGLVSGGELPHQVVGSTGM